MIDHIKNRDLVLKELREELVGPSPQGQELDCQQPLKLTKEAYYTPWRQKDSGEEILQQEAPVGRYGVGVLYPKDSLAEELDTAEDPDSATPEGDPASMLGRSKEDDLRHERLDRLKGRAGRGTTEEQGDDFDLSTANARWPSSMAISFFAEIPDDAKLVVEVPTHTPDRQHPVNGRYESVDDWRYPESEELSSPELPHPL